MHDIKLIRDNPQGFDQGLARRGLPPQATTLVSLDENGKSLGSRQLSGFIKDRGNESVKRLIFLIGGAYGLDVSLLKKSKFVWSLSSLTFPHQLVRLILVEQIYRACSIGRNEKYHHD